MEFTDISELIVNDEDISNEEEVYEEVVEPVRRRGKDINWMLQDHWKNNDDFLESDFKKELNEVMKKKKGYRTEDAWSEHWVCKFYDKRGFYPCPRQMKIHYPHTYHEIILWTNDENHSHGGS